MNAVTPYMLAIAGLLSGSSGGSGGGGSSEPVIFTAAALTDAYLFDARENEVWVNDALIEKLKNSSCVQLKIAPDAPGVTQIYRLTKMDLSKPGYPNLYFVAMTDYTSEGGTLTLIRVAGDLLKTRQAINFGLARIN